MLKKILSLSLFIIIISLSISYFVYRNIDNKKYLSSMNYLNKIYEKYNQTNEIDDFEDFNKNTYGNYVKLIELEKNFLKSNDKIEKNLASSFEKINSIDFKKITQNNYELLNSSIIEISSSLSEYKNWDTRADSHIKSLNSLKINKYNKDNHINLFKKSNLKEKEYYVKYSQYIDEYLVKYKNILNHYSKNLNGTINTFECIDLINTEIVELNKLNTKITKLINSYNKKIDSSNKLKTQN